MPRSGPLLILMILLLTAFCSNQQYQETAQGLRRHIYAAGGTDEPMELYKKFRGN